MNTDAFCADYQDPNCYSYIDQGNDDQCAWEFLRRNEDYAADYQHHFDDQAIYENEAQHHSLLVKSDSPFKEGTYYIPEPESGESLQQWMFRMEENGIEYHILSPARYFGHKWGLDQAIQSPLVQSIPKFRRYRYPRTLHWTELPHLFSSEEYGFSQCTDVLVVGLDLRSDFKNQENTLAKLFKAEKSKRSKDAENYKSPNHQRKLWIQYLRVIDAQRQGVTYADMASTLAKGEENSYPDKAAEKKLRQQLKAGLELVNIGYRRIVYPMV